MKFLILFCVYLTTTAPSHSQEWNLKRNTNNIKVYTRELDSTKFNEYKAVLIARTSIKKALETIVDADNLKKWNYKTPQSKLVKKISDSEFVFWMENDLPWPISNRDHVSSINVSQPEANTYKIVIKPADSNYVEKEKNIIRMDNFEGYWLIKEIGKDSVEITQQMYGDPKGTIPSWLVNSILVTFPYHSFENLKEILEN
ncbi:START domain-containing protein [Galbibacter pacificus]|uniref:START domain-containing protein n=1 Tax=Galbibacter pacificus TaxID=2996052 RepID=A0ABT6FSC0_9FLAO|nr:START domain-containing protein [Galbibacter pacificus]MDG3582713.1 START domain-containing protein [Galbibacter pacificus]MDG3586168.1 START domain-containing protein [Galbibacter pacificus]